MTTQSPKSQRPHAPCEKPESDDLPYKETGGQIRQQGPSESGPKVPSQSFSGGQYRGGNEERDSGGSSGKAADLGHGSPGYVSAPSDANRKGGTTHQFPNGSE